MVVDNSFSSLSKPLFGMLSQTTKHLYVKNAVWLLVNINLHYILKKDLKDYKR